MDLTEHCAVKSEKMNFNQEANRSSPTVESNHSFMANNAANPGPSPGPFPALVKDEPVDDSGIASSSSDCQSPNSDRSDQSLSDFGTAYFQNWPFAPEEVRSDMNNKDNGKKSSVSNISEESYLVPKLNSHGRVKVYKCKHCKTTFITKGDLWNHTVQHIKPEKLMRCFKCPFVTEYKHHLEYHLSTHLGDKRFVCDICGYRCINKAMLTSHHKSHSDVNMYNCGSCSYSSKYSHALKSHLVKCPTHRPGVMFYPDGKINPNVIIDVHGTRRGPRARKTDQPKKVKSPSPAHPEGPVNPYSLPEQPLPLFPMPNPDVLLRLQNAFGLVNINPNLVPAASKRFFEELQQFSARLPVPQLNPQMVIEQMHRINAALISPPANQHYINPPSQESNSSSNQQPEGQITEQPLDLTNTAENEEMYQHDKIVPLEHVEVVEKMAESQQEEIVQDKRHPFECRYCCVSFAEEVMFSIHMGFHGFENPFKCNMCGETCADKLSFFLHIAKVGHKNSYYDK